MGKNIILCADGTGNKGGHTPDSNVYKIYRAVDKHYAAKKAGEQIVYYDNGVGTAANKIIRAVTAGFGYGVKANVKELYRYLARNYESGDQVYVFGFSRGAATIRALLGFINVCGLVNGNDKAMHQRELDAKVKHAMRLYQAHRSADGADAAETFRQAEDSHGVIDIHFVGLWDTVSALGFPHETDHSGPFMTALDKVFSVADKMLEKVWPHKFYDFELSANVQHAYQALAIDDERTAFKPLVWNETQHDNSVEQVWFAGVHSNVGGGYERAGVANVALLWMLERAHHCGLKFKKNTLEDARASSHIHGRMYDSRAGAAMFYRYHPREIEVLCADKLRGPIKIHHSVLERMQHRTANYAPGQLPAAFEVVGDAVNAEAISTQTPAEKHQDDWFNCCNQMRSAVNDRKELYGHQLAFTLAMVILILGLWSCGDINTENKGNFITQPLAAVLTYILPAAGKNFVQFTVINQPWIFAVIVISIALFLKKRNRLKKATVDIAEKIRRLISQP